MNKQSYSFLTHLIPPSYIFLDNPLKIHATIIFQVNWLTNQDQLDKASPGYNCHSQYSFIHLILGKYLTQKFLIKEERDQKHHTQLK